MTALQVKSFDCVEPQEFEMRLWPNANWCDEALHRHRKDTQENEHE